MATENQNDDAFSELFQEGESDDAGQASPIQDPSADPSDNNANELDSFFDDISAIDESGDSQAGQSSATLASAKKSKQGGGLFKKIGGFFGAIKEKISRKLLIIGLSILLLLGAGFFVISSDLLEDFNLKNFSPVAWFQGMFEDSESIDPDEEAVTLPEVGNLGAVVTEEPKIKIVPKKPAAGFARNGSWYIQIAACINEPCRKNADALFDEVNIPTTFRKRVTERQTSEFVKLYSTTPYEHRKLAELSQKKFNLNNNAAYQAYIEVTNSNYQLVFGIFPLDTYGIEKVIKNLRDQVALLLPDTLVEEVYQQKSNEIHRYFIGPFASKEKGQNFLDSIQTKKAFALAFLTSR